MKEDVPIVQGPRKGFWLSGSKGRTDPELSTEQVLIHNRYPIHIIKMEPQIIKWLVISFPASLNVVTNSWVVNEMMTRQSEDSLEVTNQCQVRAVTFVGTP